MGTINNVEIVSWDESSEIFKIYKEKGWIENMKNDVERVGANSKRFMHIDPSTFFNIKFKFRNFIKPDELIEISNSDLNITTNHYRLLPQKAELEFETEPEISNYSNGKLKNTNRRKRVFNIESEYDPYHDQMQNELYILLDKSLDYKKVWMEDDRVDLIALTKDDKWHYFELKTDNPKLSIRKALGQILEYAFFPNQTKADKLIIIADEKPSTDIIIYLNHIRNKFALPIFYRQFDIETKILSDEY